MTPTLPPARCFDDADEFAETLLGWNLSARKLERGPFHAQLRQVERGPLRLVHLRLAGPLELEGGAPRGCLSFGMPTRRSPPARWCAREASAHTMSLYGDEDGFEAATRAGFESLVLSVSAPYLTSVATELGLDRARPGQGQEVVTCDLRQLISLRSFVRAALLGPATPSQDPTAHERIAHLLTRELLTTLAPADPRAPASVRAATVARACSHIAAFPHEALTVRDLCRAAGASERTLRRAFVEHFGLSPKAYLQARRLHGVRRELRRGRPDARVMDVANDWGFWHLGQFASDYRRLFGELPSQTLSQRTSRTRAVSLEARS